MNQGRWMGVKYRMRRAVGEGLFVSEDAIGAAVQDGVLQFWTGCCSEGNGDTYTGKTMEYQDALWISKGTIYRKLQNSKLKQRNQIKHQHHKPHF